MLTIVAGVESCRQAHGRIAVKAGFSRELCNIQIGNDEIERLDIINRKRLAAILDDMHKMSDVSEYLVQRSGQIVVIVDNKNSSLHRRGERLF